MEGCALLFVVILGVAIAISVHESNNRSKILRAAHAAYNRALANLRAEPANPHLREEALRLGRVYSNLTRDRRGVSIFDEVALMNDLNAACAAASVAQPRLPAGSRLARLHELKEQGLITQEEHDQRRREILKEI